MASKLDGPLIPNLTFGGNRFLSKIRTTVPPRISSAKLAAHPFLLQDLWTTLKGENMEICIDEWILVVFL